MKVFEDHMYFLHYESGEISVLSYSYDETTDVEVEVKLKNKVTKT